MKLSAEERAERKAAFRRMDMGEKLSYLAAYYKLPIALGLAAVLLAGSAIFRALTKKEAILYAGLANVTVGDAMRHMLSDGFVLAEGEDPARKEVYIYSGLYLSEAPAAENHQYSYASRLKLLAAMEAKQLDVVLMNRESYDVLSRSGYLLDLRAALAQAFPDAYALLAPCLQTNSVVLSDNAIEYDLNEADAYHAVTQSVANGLDITGAPGPARAGFTGTVYLGILANSPRLSESIHYAVYLVSS